jgi:hypothetical protein
MNIPYIPSVSYKWGAADGMQGRLLAKTAGTEDNSPYSGYLFRLNVIGESQ